MRTRCATLVDMGLRRSGALAALALLLGCGAPDREAPPAAPPRGAVLVVVDTLRADHLGCYGYERETSPRIDRLAREGVRFEQALAPSPWTLPSLATLFTGLYPSVHGATAPSPVGEVEWLFEPEAFRPESALHGSRTTLAEILRREGFATAAFVQGSYPAAVFGFAQGFDHYRDNRTPGLRFDVEDALAWLDERRPERFLLYLHTIEVHSPYAPIEIAPGFEARRPDAPLAYYRDAVREEQERFRRLDPDPDYRGPVDGSIRNLREMARASQVLAEADRERLVSLYDRGIRYTDHWLGVLLDALAERGLDDEVAIVFTSDHGEEFFEHGGLEHGRTYFEEVLRVPLIVRVPGEGAGVVVEQPVGLVDLAPTLLDVLGVDAPERFQGHSLRPLWRGGEIAPRTYVGEANLQDRGQALRGPRWKYIRTPQGERAHDLRRDPGETRDACAAEPARCARMRERLEAWNAEARTFGRSLGLPEAAPAEIDRETLERLESLGYRER